MAYSHRDRRMHRAVRDWTLWVALASATVVALAATVPIGMWGLGLVAVLAAIGGLFLVEADRRVREYVRDLESVRRGARVSGRLVVEVGSRVGLDRVGVGPSRRSPNVRRTTPGVPPEQEDGPYTGA